MKKVVDKKLLKALVPINALTPQHFNEIADKTVVEDLPAGRVIFKEGERDNQTVYLLAGEVNLFAGSNVIGSVAGDTDAARHPLAPHQPRQVTVKARTPVTIARIDTSLLDVLLTWDQSSGYEVSELAAGDDDWLSRMLQSQAFQKLPPANMQKLLMSVEELPVSSGSVVIRQGDPGDYYYIIKQGRCAVTRKAAPTAQDVKLAELSVGDSFGEDALISDSKRNATITMMTDGRLMRLAKKDFVALLREPLLNQVSYARAMSLVHDGAAWLDVRLPGEFQQGHIADAVNIPLSALRHRMSELDRDGSYVVYCDSGGRSSTAAFLMSQHGFDVHVLAGGTQALSATEARAAQAQEVPAGGAAVIDFDQELQARKKAEESVVAGAEARRQAQQEAGQLLAEARAQAEDLQARAHQLLREAEQQSRELRAQAEAQLAQAEQAQQAGKAQQTAAQTRLAEERDAAQRRVAEMEAAHAQLGKELAQLREALQAERARVQQLAASRDESGTALQQLRDELKAAQREAHAAEQARQALTQELSTTIARMQQVEQAAQQQIAAAQSAAQQQVQAELAQTRAQLDALQTQFSQARQQAAGQLARQDEKIAAMKARLESARQQVLDAEHQKTDLAAARDALRQRAAELQTELAQFGRLRERLESTEQHAAQQTAARQEQEQELQRLRGTLEQARQGWQAQEDAQREELAALQRQLADSQAQAQELVQTQQRQLEAHGALETQLSELQARLAAAGGAAQRVEQLTAELEQLKERHGHSEQQQQNLDAQRQAAMEQVAQLRAALEAREREAGAQSEQLRAELERAERAAAEQVRELSARQEQQQQALSAQQQQAAQEIARLRAELQDKERALERQAADLGDALAQSRDQLQQTQQQADTLVEQLQAQLDRARQEATQRINLLEAQLAEQQQTLSVEQRDTATQLMQLRTELERQVQEAERQTAQLRDELTRTQARHAQAGQQAEGLIEQLRTQLAEAQRTVQNEAQLRGEEAGRWQQSLETARAASQAERDELLARIHALQADAAAALNRTSQQADERLAAELARLRAELDAAQQAALTEITELRRALQQADGTHAAELERVQRERAEAQARAQSLEEKIEQANRFRAQAEASAAALEQDLERLRAEIKTVHLAARDEGGRAQREVEALRTDQQRLRAALEQAEQRHAAADAEQARLQGMCDSLKVELQHADEQLNRALAEGDAVEQERTRAEVEIARLKARVMELENAAQSEEARGGKTEKKHAAALAKARAEMAAIQDEARRHSENLQAQLEHARQQGQEADARFARQQAQLSEFEAQLDQARRRAAGLVQDVEDVKQQLETQTQLRLAAENARKVAQQEVDALRAEAEIINHLGDDHADAASAQRMREQQQIIARLEEELQQAKKNVEVAVRLRAEAESTRQALELHSARLQEELDLLTLQAQPGAAPRAARRGRSGFEWRSGPGLGLTAGWLVAVLLGAYLFMSGGKTVVPTSPSPVAIAPAPSTPPKAPAPAAQPAVAKPAAAPVKAAAAQQPAVVVHALGSFRDALRDGGSGPLMTRLPAGDYLMGSAPNSLNFDETPRHKVVLKSFAIGSYEVSFADYERFTSATGRALPADHGWGHDRQPVINLSWEDAVAYTRWLSEQTGHHYRLPSEAEWEYAAAAGVSTFYWWGNNSGENRAACFNCGSDWDGRQTAPVGSFAANAFGLYDTAGNVLEWVADCRHENYQGAPADGGVWSGGDCTRHMARGGAYDSPADNLRIQKRAYFTSGTRLDNLGLRVARDD